MSYFDAANALPNHELEEMAQQWAFNNREPQGLDVDIYREVWERKKALIERWHNERGGDRTQEEIASFVFAGAKAVPLETVLKPKNRAVPKFRSESAEQSR